MRQPGDSHYQPGRGYCGKQNPSIWKVNISDGVGRDCITVAQTLKGQFTTKIEIICNILQFILLDRFGVASCDVMEVPSVKMSAFSLTWWN